MNVRFKQKATIGTSSSRACRDKKDISLSMSRLLMAGAVMLGSQVAQAEVNTANDFGGLEEIVVTATRQSVSDQHVPISLTAIGASQLEDAGITNAMQLSQLAPSMLIVGTVSEGSPRFSMRGVSNNDTLPAGSSAIATYIDDVFQASQFGITNALFDLQRIEVLRGPQGTTFGRNTTGGAVEYFSQMPTNEYEGYMKVRAAVGNRPERSVEAAINVPLIDNMLALRFSGLALAKDAYVRDTTLGTKRGDSNSQAGRGQLHWTPSDSTMVNLTIFSTNEDGDGPLARAQAGSVPVARDVVNLSPRDFYDDFQNNGATLRIEQDMGLAKLTSITHYRRTQTDQAQDIDGALSPFTGQSDDFFVWVSHAVAKQYGQELRLSFDPARRISGIAGLYFEKDKVDDHTTESSTLGSFLLTNVYNNPAHYVTETKTYAAFANLTVKLLDTLSITGGVRKTYDKRDQDASKMYFQTTPYPWTDGNVLFAGSPPIPPDQILTYSSKLDSQPLTWDATINFEPTSNLTLFVRAAKGFRSGGFNPAVTVFPYSAVAGPPFPLPFFPQSQPEPFDPETLQSYEAGVKSYWFDHKLRLNVSAYHYKYDNQQVTIYPGGVLTTANAASSKIDGGEVEVAITPIRDLEISGNVSYTDSRYKEYIDEFNLAGAQDYSGNQLIQSPKWTASLGLNYSVPVSSNYQFAFNTLWSYRSAVYFDGANSPEITAGAMTVGNVRLGFQPVGKKGFSFMVFADNVTDRRPLDSGYSPAPGQFIKFFGAGRLVGADVGYKW